AALTARDITGGPLGTSVVTGGAATGLSTMTVRRIFQVDIDVAGGLNTLTAAGVGDTTAASLVTLTAERFGKVKTRGNTAAGIAGDFNAHLTSRAETTAQTIPVAVGSASIKGQLSGVWDLSGDIGVFNLLATVVTAASTVNWTLGASGPGA